MTVRRVVIACGGLAVAVLLVVGLVQLAETSPAPSRPSSLTAAQVRARLAGSPPELASLHAQAGELLGGGLGALRARLAALAGRPVVINKWASWCGPCRSEFPAFQNASVAQGRRVAFIGIDSDDTSAAAASAFLRSYPVSYPSYYDHSGQAGLAITDSSFTPVTVFYDGAGHVYIRQGPYPTRAKLEADISRYALDAPGRLSGG